MCYLQHLLLQYLSHRYCLHQGCIHYVAWKKSNGIVIAYKLHAEVLQEAPGVEILSLHSVRKLAVKLTDFQPVKVDICP